MVNLANQEPNPSEQDPSLSFHEIDLIQGIASRTDNELVAGILLSGIQTYDKLHVPWEERAYLDLYDQDWELLSAYGIQPPLKEDDSYRSEQSFPIWTSLNPEYLRQPREDYLKQIKIEVEASDADHLLETSKLLDRAYQIYGSEDFSPLLRLVGLKYQDGVIAVEDIGEARRREIRRLAVPMSKNLRNFVRLNPHIYEDGGDPVIADSVKGTPFET